MQHHLWTPDPAGAVIDGPYRYLLWREWDPNLPRLLWVMLNPSTADENSADPTLRRCIGFAKTWVYGSIELVNLYAWRSPSPKALLSAENPVGDQNDRYIQEAAGRAAQIVVAWGVPPLSRGRDRVVLALLSPRPLWCLGTTQDGHPGHPLFLPGTTALRPFGHAGQLSSTPMDT